MINNIIGIIGGNGVQASIELLHKIEEKNVNSGAFRNQHHPEMILYQATQAPSRSMFLEGRGKSFLPDYVRVGKKLKLCGANYLCMCCNTAHYFVEELSSRIGLPFINMLSIVSRNIAELKLEKYNIGILCSDGTSKTKLYDKYLKSYIPSCNIIYPNSNYQKLVTEGICNVQKDYHIKLSKKDVSRPLTLFKKTANNLVKSGCNIILLGCTEIPLDFDFKYFIKKNIIIIDCLDVLADECIRISKGRFIADIVDVDNSKIVKLFNDRADEKEQLQSIMLSKSNDVYPEKRNNNEKELLKKYIEKDILYKIKVMDIGCGMGRMARNLLPFISSYLGIDLAEKNILIARNNFLNNKNIFFQNMSATDIVIDKLLLKPPYNFFLLIATMIYINDIDCENILKNMLLLADKHCTVYIRESISVMDKRLTLKDFYSDELKTEYSAIYRTEKEYMELFDKYLIKNGFKLEATDLLLKGELQNRKETNQRYWIFKRS